MMFLLGFGFGLIIGIFMTIAIEVIMSPDMVITRQDEEDRQNL